MFKAKLNKVAAKRTGTIEAYMTCEQSCVSWCDAYGSLTSMLMRDRTI